MNTYNNILYVCIQQNIHRIVIVCVCARLEVGVCGSGDRCGSCGGYGCGRGCVCICGRGCGCGDCGCGGCGCGRCGDYCRGCGRGCGRGRVVAVVVVVAVVAVVTVHW